MAYDIEEHRHRFAVWASARAVRRAGNTAVRKALESSTIRAFVKKYTKTSISKETFEKHHRKICLEVMKSLGGTFGRAAKHVNIYLKSVVVLGPGNGQDSLGKVAHPPIDNLLLAETKKQFNLKELKTTWMDLTEKEYYSLIHRLGQLPNTQPFWMLEEHWNISKDGE